MAMQPAPPIACLHYDGVFWHKDRANVVWRWDEEQSNWRFWNPVEGGPIPPPVMWGLPIDVEYEGVKWRKNADQTIWRWDAGVYQWVYWTRGGPGPEPPEVIMRTVYAFDPMGRQQVYGSPGQR